MEYEYGGMALKSKIQILRAVHLSVCLMVFVAGCANRTEKASCDARDWYETGRRDGSQGATLDRLASYKRECGEQLAAFSETMYTNGRNAGLVEYCAADNSFELGRMGIAYHYTCPSTMEPDFLAGYRRGQEARKLEIENQKLDAEIDALLAKLNSESSQYSRREIASELEQLRKSRAKNEKDLSKVSN